ncbi:hypothetical protein MRB53_036912 [Persea americana]|nr:hypothetical protein MRB53_036912 [Persea americana]
MVSSSLALLRSRRMSRAGTPDLEVQREVTREYKSMTMQSRRRAWTMETAYLFNKENGLNELIEDEDARDPLSQMEATKDMLTEAQKIAYVGLTRLAMSEILVELQSLERTKGAKKELDYAVEGM